MHTGLGTVQQPMGAHSSPSRRTTSCLEVDSAPGVSLVLSSVCSLHLNLDLDRPNAPVTYSQERVRPSWFNIASLPPCNCYDETGISSGVAKLENLIISEVRQGTTSSKIVLVGFSQGASLSLMTALTTLHELGGVASLSGWIPKQSRPVSRPPQASLVSRPLQPCTSGYATDRT